MRDFVASDEVARQNRAIRLSFPFITFDAFCATQRRWKTHLFDQRRTLSDAAVTFCDFGAMIHVSSLTYLLTFSVSEGNGDIRPFDFQTPRPLHYVSKRERERERERECRRQL